MSATPSPSSLASDVALILGSGARAASPSPSSPAGLDLVLVSGACGGSIALVSTSAFISDLDIISTGAFVSSLALAVATRHSISIASPHPFLLCETER
jgi:hypothetical protein